MGDSGGRFPQSLRLGRRPYHVLSPYRVLAYVLPIFLGKSSQVNTILFANTNSLHNRHTNKKVMEFVKGKPKGTNPAIMGNPINMYAVNGNKYFMSYEMSTSYLSLILLLLHLRQSAFHRNLARKITISGCVFFVPPQTRARRLLGGWCLDFKKRGRLVGRE